MRARWFLPCACLYGLGLSAACGNGDESPAELLAPPEPGRGVQYKMVTSLAPGVEAEHCLFVQAPAEPIHVNRDQVRFTAGSHHFLLYETAYETIPTAREDGTPVDTSGVFDCSDGATNGWKVNKLVGGSQNGQGDSLLAFPPGVALPVRANAVLLMNTHYINATEKMLTPEARINLHTIPASDVVEQGDLLFLYNPLIKAPARGNGRARYRCPVNRDITVTNVQSHMHARGVGYAAGLVGQAPFYENDRWSEVPVKSFGPGMVVPAGSVFDYYCDYRNGEAHDVFQGPRSTDEMCMLIGSFYPADPTTASCTDASGSFSGEWVGNGSATCAQTLACLGTAVASDKPLRPITDCVMAADPQVSAEVSALLRCLFAKQEMAACVAERDACAVK